MEKKATVRRFLSLLIAVLMVTSVIPQAAYAAIADAAGTDRAPGRAVVNGGVDGTAIEIEGVNSVIVSGATEQENGDYVWTPSNTNPDHPFKFNVTYSVSGEFEYFESNQIEVRIPMSILKDRNGNPADYFEMSLPRDDEEGLDDDNVFVYRIDEETNEIVVYNRLPCPAAQHGYFEISYNTSKRTYDYQDYDPDGEKPEDRNPSADFQATLTISRDGETHSKKSDPVHVYIDTSAKITKQTKAAPQKQYDGGTQWQSNWGTKPADADLYYYLIWEVRSTIVATQRYDFTLTDTYDAGGELVGIKMQGQSQYVPVSDLDCGKVYNQTTSYPNGRYDYILTRHLKSTYDPQETYSFLNKANGHVHPLDGVDADTDAPSQRRWTFEHPVFVPSGTVGVNGFDKYGLDYNDRKVVNSESIRMFDLEPYYLKNRDTIPNLKWYSGVTVTTWNLTVDGDNRDPANYGKKNATVTLTDNQIKIRVLAPADSSAVATLSRPLVAGEYRFDKVTFGYTFLDAYFDEESQSFKTKKVTYSEDDAIVFYAQFGTDEWVNVGSYNIITGVFTPTAEGTAHQVTAEGKTVLFGDGTCTGYRLASTNKHYRTSLTAYPYVTLLRCQLVTEVVDEAYDAQHNEIVVNNTADFAVYDGDEITDTPYRSGSKSGNDYATGIVRQSSITKTVRYVNQPVDQNVRLTWTVNMNETYLAGAGRRAYVPQESGVFYDLLPIGGTFDASSLVVWADSVRLNPNEYTYSLEQNFRNTGRWLLTIRISEPANRTYSFTYATNHSWDTISEFGTDVLNSVAYETGNVDIGDGSPDDGGPSSGYPDHEWLIDLDPDTDAKKFIYTKVESTLHILTAGNLGLYKKIAAAGDEKYTYKTTTVSGGDYSYRIHFATDAATWAKDMILVDSLENFITLENQSSEWHGILQGFDMSVLTARGIDWKLYYSTTFTGNFVEALNITADYDFSAHTDVWAAATNENDPALVDATAWAIDLRMGKNGEKFVLDPSSAISVTVFMKAPETLESDSIDPIAYNNIYLLNSVKFGKDSEFSDFSSNHQDYTQISFRQIADVELLKIDSEAYETTGEIVPIPGITFRLWGDSQYGDVIDITLTTNSQGKIVFDDIPRGNYHLQEVDGVDDYLQDHTQMTLTIDQNGVVNIGEPQGGGTYDWTVYGSLVIGVDNETGVWTLGNPPRIHGDLAFDKKGAVDGERYTVPVPYVKFVLTGTSDYGTDVRMILTGGADGVVHINNLEKGTYEMVETEAGSGYTLNGTVFTVRCDETGEITIYYKDGDEIIYPLENGIFTIINEPFHTLKLWKYNSVNFAIVAGAKFSLSGSNYYEEAVSEASGLITFNNLRSGTYTLKELEAPSGFELDPASHIVVISEDGSATIDGKTIDQFVVEFLASTSDPDDYAGTVWDYFPIPNTPVKKTITIVKEWEGLAEGEEPDATPVLHLDTDKPEFNFPEATIDYNAWVRYVNGVDYNNYGVPINKHGLLQDNFRIARTQEHEETKVRIDFVEFKKYDGTDIPSAEQMNQSITESWADIAEATAATAPTSPAIFTDETVGVLEKWRRIDDGTTDYRIFIKLEFIEHALVSSMYIDRYRAVWWSDAPNVYFPSSTVSMFSGLGLMTSYGSLDLRGIKLSRTTNASSMFNVCNCGTIRMETDTGKITDMSKMFRQCTSPSLALPDVPGFDTSSVTNMSQMFEATRLSSLPLNGWNTSNVTDMSRMFYGSGTNLTSLEISEWDTSNVTNMSGMFCELAKIQDFGISGWDVGKVKDMSQMFRSCASLSVFGFSSWNVSSVETMANMFSNCTNLVSVDMSSWNTENVTSMYQMFNNNTKLQNVTLPTGASKLAKVKTFYRMFYYCESLTSIDFSERDLSGLTQQSDGAVAGFTGMFQNCSSLETADFHGSYAPNTSYLGYMFQGCSSMTVCNFSGAIIGGNSTGDYTILTTTMFRNCKVLKEVDLSGLAAPTAAKKAFVQGMFGECNSLEVIYTSAEWPDTVSEQASSMFTNCNRLPHPTSSTGQNFAMFTENGGNFTYKAAPAVPTFPTASAGIISADNAAQPNALPANNAQITADSGTSAETEGSGLVSQISDANKWVKNNDGTWSYTFDVYDVDATYYLWEGVLPGWETDAGIDHPITIVYKKGGTIQSAASDLTPTNRLVDLGGGKYAVKIKNTKIEEETASLTVKKEVTGEGDKQAQFTIHIKFSDATLNGTYGDVTLKNGEADVKLSGGASVTLTGLPVGVTYTVTEPDPQGHESTINNGSGTIDSATASVTVTVKNHKNPPPPTSGLDIKKIMAKEGNAALTAEDLARKFPVTVTLYTDSALTEVAAYVNGAFGDVAFTNGVGSVMIAKDEVLHVTGLPMIADESASPVTYSGLYYKAVEGTVEGYTVTYTAQSGQTKEANVPLVTVKNTKQEPRLGGFKVVKVLEGASATDTTEFIFTVEFDGLTPGASYKYTVGGTEFTFSGLTDGTGFVQFVLTNGKTAEFTNLPEGTAYTVTEASSGYIASYTVVSDKTVASASGKNSVPYVALSTATETVEKDENATVTFTNAPAYVNKNGFKIWNDNSNTSGIRPESITIYLMAGTAQIDSVTVTAEDDWKWSFDNLPKYDEHGNEIVYTFEEDIVEGYDTEYVEHENGDIEVINTHVPAYIDIPVEKIWLDNDNAGGTRPANIVVNLYADGVLSETVRVSPDNDGRWHYTFEHLRKYRAGTTEQIAKNEIEYTVTENAVGGYIGKVEPYSVTTGSVTVNGFKITNTLVIKIEGEKIWHDGENANKTRPNSVTVHLYADNADTGRVVVATAPDWSWSFSNLDKYKLVGEEYVEIVYTVVEDAVPGYITDYDGYNVINTEKTSATVKKVWDDHNDFDHIRPSTLVVELSNGSKTVGSVTLSERNSWTDTINDLPKYDENGDLITYTWEEKDLPNGYRLANSSVNGTITTITNKHDYHAEGSIPLEAKKELNGRKLKENEFGFELYDAEGNLLETVYNDKDGKIKFTDLAYTLDQVGEHTYTVKEIKGNLGGVTYDNRTYTVKIKVSDNGDGTLKVERTDDIKDLVFTNTYKASGELPLQGRKVLSGRQLKAGEFEFDLYEGNKLLQTKTNAADGTIVFDNITYTEKDLGEHTYRVVEKLGSLTGVTYDTKEYTITVNVSDNGDGTLKVERTGTVEDIVFNNTYSADGSIPLQGRKVLNGRELKAGEFSFELYKGETLIESVQNNAQGNIVFTPLKFTLDQVGEYTYTVVEKAGNLGGVTYDNRTYTVKIKVSDNGDGTLKVERTDDIKDIEFKNDYTADGKIPLDGKKVLNGRELKENEFGFELYDAEGNLLETVFNDKDGKIKFTDLAYTLDQVGEHTYTVKEIKGDLYAVTYDTTVCEIVITVSDNGDGTLKVERTGDAADIVFNNRYDVTEATVKKIWDDNDNQDGIRPDDLVIALMKGEEKIAEVVLNDDNGWTETVKDLAKYEKDGVTEIEYTWVEVEIPEGYTLKSMEKEGVITSIINPHTPEVTEATVKKIWDDNDNQDGIRPDRLLVNLMNGETVIATVELYDYNDWTATVSDLSKYEKGVEIVYTWSEVDLPEGYELSGSVCEATVTTLTNTHTPEKIEIKGGKIWRGEIDPINSRPVSITVRLYADGEQIRSIEVTSLNDWTFSFDGLDKYKDGKQIVYTLGEVPVPGYVTEIDDENYIIVNDWITPPPPQTADANVVAAAGMMLAAILGMAVLIKKKRERVV